MKTSYSFLVLATLVLLPLTSISHAQTQPIPVEKRTASVKHPPEGGEEDSPEMQKIRPVILGLLAQEKNGTLKDDPVGSYVLGTAFDKGVVVEESAASALALFSRAANRGHAPSQAKLGDLYYEGRSLPKDWSKAAAWFKMAAEQGDAEGCARYGLMVFNGESLAQNKQEGLRWLQKAARGGDVGSIGLIAKSYRQGICLVKDPVRAAAWDEAYKQGKSPKDDALVFPVVGIGTVIEIHKESKLPQITKIIQGTPAASVAGLRTNLLITKVDNVSTAGRSLDDVVGLIRGTEGTTVVLDVADSPTGRVKTVRIPRRMLPTDAETPQQEMNLSATSAQSQPPLPEDFPSLPSDSLLAKQIDGMFSDVQKWTFIMKDSDAQDKILDAGERYISWVLARLQPGSVEQSVRLYHYAAKLSAKYGFDYKSVPQRLTRSSLMLQVFKAQIQVLIEKKIIPDSAVPSKAADLAIRYFAANPKQVDIIEKLSNVTFRDFASKVESDARRLLALEEGRSSVSPFDAMLLAILYNRGSCVHPDPKKHIQYLRLAAEGGQSDALLALGSRTLKGDGVPKDIPASIVYLQKAGRAGEPAAWLLLGAHYQDGTDETSKRSAYTYFRKAADLGEAQGQRMAGIKLCEGKGVEQNLKEGLKLVHKAALAGDRLAMLFISKCYQGESPLLKSESEAAKWSRAFDTGKVPADTTLKWK